jgi:hypothetical protein
MQSSKRDRKRAILGVCCAVLAGLLLLGLTTTAPPNSTVVEEVDRALQQDPCVGPVKRWSARYYAWKRAKWVNSTGTYLLWRAVGPWVGSDTSSVEVQFYQGASEMDYPPGRHMLRADQVETFLDSSNFRYVSGTYDVTGQRLIDGVCGSNAGAEPLSILNR